MTVKLHFEAENANELRAKVFDMANALSAQLQVPQAAAEAPAPAPAEEKPAPAKKTKKAKPAAEKPAEKEPEPETKSEPEEKSEPMSKDDLMKKMGDCVNMMAKSEKGCIPQERYEAALAAILEKQGVKDVDDLPDDKRAQTQNLAARKAAFQHLLAQFKDGNGEPAARLSDIAESDFPAVSKLVDDTLAKVEG